MTISNPYLSEVYQWATERDPHKPEFLQAVYELVRSLEPLMEKDPDICTQGTLERLIEPERLIQFRVAWRDRDGKVNVNRGYRTQFNSALGPYKGGLRFHKSVNSSVIKFLGFEQTFKNSLTGLPMGGAKGGSDFDPHGKNDMEVMNFCQSFMSELFRHIGANTDVPAGDIGVGSREIGYLYGQYCRLMNISEGSMTGKGVFAGGSLLRREATGYGLCYFGAEMLAQMGQTTFQGKEVVVSGSGNVALYVIKKARELGGKVIGASDSKGYILDEKGIDFDTLAQIKEVERLPISEYVNRRPEAQYFEGSKGVWTIPCQIAIPCATQNEIDLESGKALCDNGLIALIEGANMPCTREAVDLFKESGILYGPAKASNAGGVAVSGLEMAQNAGRAHWSYDKVDRTLISIMKSIFTSCLETSNEYGRPGDLAMGANIAGFTKVAKAMQWKGLI